MRMNYSDFIDYIGKIIDIAGIAVIVFGALFASISFFVRWSRSKSIDGVYTSFRQNLGRVILVGIEFLIAGDIIHSIAVTPTFASIGILGLIVIIRSILSIELEMEIEGHWPWQHSQHKEKTKE
jgi:uncharacterized membrane protein